MAVQYTNGTFSDALPIDEARRLLDEAIQADIAKAFFIGTPEQIEQVKSEKSAKELIAELQDRVAELEADKRGIIRTPNYRELQMFGGIDLHCKS